MKFNTKIDIFIGSVSLKYLHFILKYCCALEFKFEKRKINDTLHGVFKMTARVGFISPNFRHPLRRRHPQS